jgi:ribosomal protein S3
LFNNYFSFILNQVGVKGFKVKLKGKISVAGNSRKRTILYRVGQTSHASCNLRVVHHFSTIVTFTGVQGFQVWIFY